jgi:putative copper export protein
MQIRCDPMIVAQLAPAIDGLRVSLHVLAATVWVGGQLTVAGMLPTVRQLGAGAPRRIANAFARLSWPAYAILVATGIWNVSAVGKGQPTAWQVLLGVKIAVVVIAGLGAWLHGRAKSRAWLGIWGGVAGIASVAVLVMGVFLAG